MAIARRTRRQIFCNRLCPNRLTLLHLDSIVGCDPELHSCPALSSFHSIVLWFLWKKSLDGSATAQFDQVLNVDEQGSRTPQGHAYS